MKHRWASSILVGVLTATVPALAEDKPAPPPAVDARHDAEAHALLSAGASALEDGRFEEALEYFKRSYELSGRPEILYNIGVAHDRLRHDREAMEAFDAYLKSADKKRRADAQARLKVLKRTLAKKPAEPAIATPSAGPASPPATKTAQPDAGKSSTSNKASTGGDDKQPPQPSSAPQKRQVGQRVIISAPPPEKPLERSPLLNGM